MKVKVCFTKTVSNVATAGEIKEVSAGYYRNFLRPKGYARPATDQLVESVKVKSEREAKQKAMQAKNIKELAGILEGYRVVVHAKASEEGHLYGSVSASVIAEALAKVGHHIEESWVDLNHAIKTVGEKEVRLKLPHGEKASIVVEVKGDQ